MAKFSILDLTPLFTFVRHRAIDRLISYFFQSLAGDFRVVGVSVQVADRRDLEERPATGRHIFARNGGRVCNVCCSKVKEQFSQTDPASTLSLDPFPLNCWCCFQKQKKAASTDRPSPLYLLSRIVA